MVYVMFRCPPKGSSAHSWSFWEMTRSWVSDAGLWVCGIELIHWWGYSWALCCGGEAWGEEVRLCGHDLEWYFSLSSNISSQPRKILTQWRGNWCNRKWIFAIHTYVGVDPTYIRNSRKSKKVRKLSYLKIGGGSCKIVYILEIVPQSNDIEKFLKGRAK